MVAVVGGDHININKNALTPHSVSFAWRFRWISEEAINSTRNRIYYLKVF